MSATADATMLAIQRAAPKLGYSTDEEIMDFAERVYSCRATEAEMALVAAEFIKVTRADIGRPPLPTNPLQELRDHVLDTTAERILASWESVDNPETI
jgi:hypothetical protein